MEQRIITAGNTGFIESLKRVWRYRSLIRVLAIRDIKIRYSQTFLGVFWSILQPIVAIFIYTSFFYYVLDINPQNVPYPLFVLPGVIGWFQFTTIINAGGMALHNNSDLIKKVDFPKVVLPFSKVVSGLLEVFITFLLMFTLMIAYDFMPSGRILLLPLFIGLNILVGLSIAVWLAALTIKYRDFHHIIPYIISFGIWVTPVFYPTTILPQNLEQYMFLNPVACVIAGLRWCLIDGEFPSWHYFTSFVPVFFLFVSGYRYFFKVERTIADHV